MIKRMDKRGQEGFKLVNLILALVVLVVIALGILYFISKGKSAATNVIPDDAQIIVNGCNLVNNEVSKQSYCTQLRKVTKEVYATCDYVSTYGITIPDSKNMDSICEKEYGKPNELIKGSNRQLRISTQCTELGLKDNTRANNLLCAAWKS
tara:strand:+ start:2528 stop:2980 length:453 start_codon:yes stop_codon:yes gene_type:complete